MFGLNKIELTKSQLVFVSLFFVYIFSLGFFSAMHIPDIKYEIVYNYAVQLEKENSDLNKKLKSCNRLQHVI